MVILNQGMKMLKAIKDIKRRLRTEHELENLEQELLHALYRPVIDATFFNASPHALDWMEEDCRFKASAFHASLKPLSQYYVGINPALSAALWGIWQSLDRLRPHRGFESMNPADQETDYVRYRSIVTNAVIQFADGDSFTYVPLEHKSSPNTRKRLATRALDCLQGYQHVASTMASNQPTF